MKRYTHNLYAYLAVAMVLALWLSADDIGRIAYEWSMR